MGFDSAFKGLKHCRAVVGRTLVRGLSRSKVNVTLNMPQEVHTRGEGTALRICKLEN
jgi:hypothetical protein